MKSKYKSDRGGISNILSKVYKYLVNPKPINNDLLNKHLIIADNREDEKVFFLRKNRDDIQNLLKTNLYNEK